MSLVAANRGRSPKARMEGRVRLANQCWSSARVVLPDPMDLALWRQAAEAELERELAALDRWLLRGDEIYAAQTGVATRYMMWTRRSIAPFATGMGRSDLRSLEEVQRWEVEADRAIALADPERLERFLRIWLAVVHEAAASGKASLYAVRT